MLRQHGPDQGPQRKAGDGSGHDPAEDLAGSIGLSWDPSPGATGYRVFYGPAENNYLGAPLWQGAGTLADGRVTTTISSTALTDCATWHFAVTAYNPAGESDFSNNGNEIAFGTIGNASCAEGMFWEAVNAIGVMKAPE